MQTSRTWTHPTDERVGDDVLVQLGYDPLTIADMDERQVFEFARGLNETSHPVLCAWRSGTAS